VDLELRVSAPEHATGAVEFVPLADVSEDQTFRLREGGDVADLATSIGRLGQLAPVELRLRPGAAPGTPRWQVVAGFRRLEALRLLQRDRVLARLHEALPDEDAWALAAVHALLTEPLGAAQLESLRQTLRAAGVAWADHLVDDAQVRAPVPPELREAFHLFLRQRKPAPEEEGDGTVEVTPEEVVREILRRLYELNVDLAAAWEAWKDLPPEGRRQVVEQARYLYELFPFMEKKVR
jgi:hypothetical protein